jgi:hypothetical protein
MDQDAVQKLEKLMPVILELISHSRGLPVGRSTGYVERLNCSLGNFW